MKITLIKEFFLGKLEWASRFTSNKLSSLIALQGVLIEIKENKISFYSTNLNAYFYTDISIKTEEEVKFVIDPKKVIEFISLLPEANIDLEIKENQLIIKAGKTKGNFALVNANDFPPPPAIKEKKQPLKKSFLYENLPLVLFAASTDETRPVLNGINFLTEDAEMSIASTDGFRLSLMKIKIEDNFPLPSLIIPSDFLDGFLKFITTEDKNKKEEILFGYSKEEKAIVFQVGRNSFYSRLIEGDFPPFEKVIPSEVNTKVIINKEEFLRNIKLASVFARDYSNIVILNIRKGGLYIHPRIDNGQNEDTAYQDAQVEGKEQKIAFNFRFILDLLNHIKDEKITLEIMKPDAPAIFKVESKPNFIHLIMPVRIET